ncbi:MAG: glycoside hydrolase family 2 TIM barrel-domain containing protein [Tepidisphaeraceae bacterium]
MLNKRWWLNVAAITCAMLLCSCGSTNPSGASSQLTGSSTEAVVGPRIAIDLNSDWKFIREDVPGAEQSMFDDSSWQSVTLPHTWNNLDGEDGGNDYYRGAGWYRRHLKLDSAELRKTLFLKFDGASSAAAVYVNGWPAGPPHRGMFSAFCYDITSLVNPSSDNVIAVRVTNAIDKDIPPTSAEFTFFGGIYRGVHLLAINPFSISPLDDASPGVYLKQMNVSADHADVQITTKLRNATTVDQQGNVTCDLLDASGKTIQSINTQMPVVASDSEDVVQWLSIDHPHLWNGRKDPYLYRVRVTVADATSVVDRVVQPLGIRFFAVDPDKGFLLNGQPYPLHGVNRHQDRLDKGWAITSREQEEDFNLIMEMGCNAIRLAHYQHAQEFYDLCDRGGLVVWAEACLVNSVTPSGAFDDAARQQLRELIKQSYNHPSICFWCLFNELRDKKEKNQSEADGKLMLDHQVQLVGELNKLAHDLDPTRLTTAATNIKPDHPLNAITDVLGFNIYDGWYAKTPDNWPPDLDKLHSALPQRGLAISEYGAGASVYQHELNPTQPKTDGLWHPEEWQCVVHEAAYKAMSRRPYLWGTFLWNMFDFASDGRHEGDHLGRNDKGLVTYDRNIKKDAFYFYKANWSDEPMVYITDRRFTPRNFDHSPVKVYSNCDSVELKLNGASLGSVSSADHIFIWPDATLVRGKNVFEADGIRDGRHYSDSCTIEFDPGIVESRPFVPATQPTAAPSPVG